MGWDAYAKLERNNDFSIKDEAIRLDFLEATKACKNGVDGLLQYGGLDCSECRDMLCLAIHGLSGYEEENLSAKELDEKANWYFLHVEEDSLWAYDSAKAFLEVCAKHSLEIYFSY